MVVLSNSLSTSETESSTLKKLAFRSALAVLNVTLPGMLSVRLSPLRVTDTPVPCSCARSLASCLSMYAPTPAPVSAPTPAPMSARSRRSLELSPVAAPIAAPASAPIPAPLDARSEERRVGKEGRSRWAQERQEQNRSVSCSCRQQNEA